MPMKAIYIQSPSKSKYLEYRIYMTLLKAVLITLLFALAHSYYQLDFDWTLSKLSTDSEYGYVTWNGQTIYKLQEKEKENTLHHVQVKLVFLEGSNELSFYFEGAKGELTIGNVTITEPPKTLNLLTNGDFQLPKLDPTSTSTLFANNILGWQGKQIYITRTSNLSQEPKQALLLNAKSNNIHQTIIYGEVSNYSFLSSLSPSVTALSSSQLTHS